MPGANYLYVCIKASLVAVIYLHEILLQTGVWGWSGAKESPQEFNHLLGAKQMKWGFSRFLYSNLFSHNVVCGCFILSYFILC